MNISLQSRYVTRRDAYDTFLYKNYIKEKSDCTCFFPSSRTERGTVSLWLLFLYMLKMDNHNKKKYYTQR